METVCRLYGDCLQTVRRLSADRKETVCIQSASISIYNEIHLGYNLHSMYPYEVLESTHMLSRVNGPSRSNQRLNGKGVIVGLTQELMVRFSL